MNRNNYESPRLFMLPVESSSFICASIQKMLLYVEVDEYANCEVEKLDFDSDY